MVDHPTSLDAHRGMAAQKATELRRLRSEVEADQAALRAPATNWPEAIEKARYLLGLFAQSSAAVDPRRRKLIDRVMADFDHLLDSRRPTESLTLPETDQQRRQAMAKGEKRGNREAKKPKKEKAKEAAPTSLFASQGKGSAPAKPPGGKR